MYPVLNETHFRFPGQSGYYKGKVREVYGIDDKFLVFVVSDRVSAFDHILPRQIPYKGEILNAIAAKFLIATADIVPNWLVDVPDPAVSIGLQCEPLKVEMVIRGYLCGHAWREYKAGKKDICGVPFPSGMTQFEPFPEPVITPTTKAHEGHDEDISRDEILERRIVEPGVYEQLEQYTRQLFRRGQEMAAERGLILADTKYEFGIHGDRIYLIDEVHTPDSSRYFYRDNFMEIVEKGGHPRQLSKEFVREWLMKQGFQGREGDRMPVMNDDIVGQIMNRYIELFELVTGEKYHKSDRTDLLGRIESNTVRALEKLRKEA